MSYNGTYAGYIRELLKPLGIYKLSDGVSGGEIDAIGIAFDEADDAAEMLGRECTFATASEYGLDLYADILTVPPVDAGIKNKRKAMEALITIDEASFTVKKLNDTISGCGIAARVHEGDDPFTAVVEFPENNGYPDDMNEVKKRIEAILPCHIDCLYDPATDSGEE